MEQYRAALALDPGSSRTRLQLGLALQALGRKDEAREHLRPQGP